MVMLHTLFAATPLFYTIRSRCILLLLGIFTIVSACTTDAEETRVIEAAQAYAKANSDVDVILQVQAVEDDYARVLVEPKNVQEADEAIMYLRKNKDAWEGIAIGTSFSPDDYESLNIPEKIR